MAYVANPQALGSEPSQHDPVRATLEQPSPLIGTIAAASLDDVFSQLKSTPDGLTDSEVKKRLLIYGPNAIGGSETSPLLLEL